jgi:sugar lactone lactonase YvrE
MRRLWRCLRWRCVRWGAAAVALVVVGAAIYLTLVPSPIDAVAWSPAPADAIEPTHPIEGVVFHRGVPGPEGVAFDQAGRLYAGGADGWVYRFDDGGTPARFAGVGGRPLGIAFDEAGNLLVCNHPLGLQRVNSRGEVELLTDASDDGPIRFPNDLAIASSGVVYFTDSSDRFHLANGFGPPWGAYDMLEARPRGRLIRHDPRTGETRTVLSNLHFPNGVALSEDELAIYVVETFRYRVLRHDLMAGTTAVFLDHLPGFADGIARDGERFIVAIGVRRSWLGDQLQRFPGLRNQIARLPEALWRRTPTPAAILVIADAHGSPLVVLADDAGDLGTVTNPGLHADRLYLGTLFENHIASLPLPR